MAAPTKKKAAAPPTRTPKVNPQTGFTTAPGQRKAELGLQSARTLAPGYEKSRAARAEGGRANERSYAAPPKPVRTAGAKGASAGVRATPIAASVRPLPVITAPNVPKFVGEVAGNVGRALDSLIPSRAASRVVGNAVKNPQTSAAFRQVFSVGKKR